MANNPQQCTWRCPEKPVTLKAQTKQGAATYFQRRNYIFLNYSRGTILEGIAAGQSYCKSSLVLPAPACLHMGTYTRTDIPFSRDNDSQALTDKVRQQEVCSASENSETAGSAWMNPPHNPPKLLRQVLKTKLKLLQLCIIS